MKRKIARSLAGSAAAFKIEKSVKGISEWHNGPGVTRDAGKRTPEVVTVPTVNRILTIQRGKGLIAR